MTYLPNHLKKQNEWKVDCKQPEDCEETGCWKTCDCYPKEISAKPHFMGRNENALREALS